MKKLILGNDEFVIKPIRLFFVYKGREYIVDQLDFYAYWMGDWGEYSKFWWQEGNGSCDCNRSIFIHEKYPEFPELKCGDEIELDGIEFLNAKGQPYKNESRRMGFVK